MKKEIEQKGAKDAKEEEEGIDKEEMMNACR
jgi:hypothetical protein